MQRHKQIVIVGNVGAGKSTLTSLVETRLPAQQVPADSLFRVNPFFPLAVSNRARWSLTSDLWFLYERVKLAREIDQILKQEHVVVDSGLPMSFVYSHSRLGSGYFTDDEWSFYETLYFELTDDLRDPDLVIYLHAPIEVLRERIHQRGREHELKYYTREYLQSLTNSIEYYLDTLVDSSTEVCVVDVMEVDFLGGRGDVSDLLERIVQS